jgi:hypothetical protein
LIAGNAQLDYAKEEQVPNVTEKTKQWLRSGDGRAYSKRMISVVRPDRECSSDPRPVLEFSSPKDGSTITESPLPISGVIDTKNGGFTSWRLEYSEGNDNWTVLAQNNTSFPQPAVIYTWDLKDIKVNQITLRLYLMNGEEFYAEKRIRLSLNLPQPTNVDPTPTTILPTAFPDGYARPCCCSYETLTPFPQQKRHR